MMNVDQPGCSRLDRGELGKGGGAGGQGGKEGGIMTWVPHRAHAGQQASRRVSR